jgi:pseudaminic acid synthase
MFNIDGKKIGAGYPAYIVAEMSANHGNDLARALEIIHAAKETGVDAIKLQTYTADTLTLKCKSDFFYIDHGPWKGQYFHDLYADASTPWDWHARLKEEADSIGLTLFSAPFDPLSVELLKQLDMPAYKIASPEIIELALIEQVAATGKPLIISTGDATLAEIEQAVHVAKSAGATQICLLKCTSVYPAPAKQINLRTISHMQQAFSCPVGLSDHSLGIGVAIASVAMGACMVEKHIVMDKNDNTADSFFSLTPDEFSVLVDGVRVAEQALGEVTYPLNKSTTRRSLIVIEDIAKGEVFSRKNVRSLRPGGGLEPKQLENILGRVARDDITLGQPLTWSMVGG